MYVGEFCSTDERFLLKTEKLPNDLNFMPSLANGHLGYTVFGDAIFMNGVYNGRAGDSRRARIPNWLNVSVDVQLEPDDLGILHDRTSLYELNLKDGYFRWQQTVPELGLTLEQRTYAHRYHNRALIYELSAWRNITEEALLLKITQHAGNASKAFDFAQLDGDVGGPSCAEWRVLKGVTREVENEEFQKEKRTVFVVLSEDLTNGKVLKMAAGQTELCFRYILTADEDETTARSEMQTISKLSQLESLQQHASEWHKFWENFNIEVEGNLELSHTINAGIFYLANSLPSPHTNQPNHAYFGLSPTGLARGQLDDDYNGHNFWDTEIWMLPVVTQFSTEWARALLQYRLDHLNGARYNAKLTGYKGARFPWETAYTGTEVTHPDYPEVAAYEVHISADIAFALQQHYANTNDREWLCEVAWPIVSEIATFMESRVEWDEELQKYHVKDVMGPDEDHCNVTDNVYTNVVFKLALEFAGSTQRACSPSSISASESWLNISQNLLILYDAALDYHPQHSGYQRGERIKQADTILLGYPLQYAMNISTRFNDLSTYEPVTRPSGPAMTWSMFAINYLDVNETEKAHHFFEKCYKDYVRPEFKVWSETKIGYHGSANFITGVGGFLQAVINGYGGVRFRRDNQKSIMEIRPTHLLPNSQSVTITGLKFADATFALQIKLGSEATLSCLEMGKYELTFVKADGRQKVSKGFTVVLAAETVIIETAETI